MAGNICRCGTYPRIEEAIRIGATDPHREGGRGPLRGGLARRRGGSARAVAGGPARRRRPAGAAPDGLGAGARRGAASPATSGSRGCSTPRSCARPHAHARVRADRPRAAPSPRPACAARSARATATGLDAEADYEGAPVAAVCADTFRAGAGRARARRRSSGRSSRPCSTRRRRSRAGEFTRPSRSATSAATSSAGSRRRTSSSRRTYRTSGRAAQLDGDAPGRRATGSATRSRCTSRRSTSGACARRWPRRSASPADKVRVVCDFMGGGFGSKNGAGEYTFVAAELARRTGRPVRCMLTRREENIAAGNRNATIQQLVVGARSDGTIIALGGEFVNAVGWSGWTAMTEGPMQMLYACDNVRTVCYGAKLNLPPMKAVPGARLRRGDVRARVPARRARGEARPRPARAAAAQLRRLDTTGHAVLGRRTCASATSAPRSTGSAATRCAPARRLDVQARRRHGEPDLVRRRRPASYAWIARRLGRPRRRRHARCRTSAPARRRRWRRSPPRSSAYRSTASTSPSATRRAARTRRSRPARRPCPRWARRCARPRPTRSGRSSSSRRSATTLEERAARHRATATIVSADGSLAAARGARRPARQRADPRQGRARPEPGRHERAHLRRPGGRGRRRRRDRRGDASSGSRRSTTSAASINPLGASSQVEGGIIQGDRPHALRAAAARPGDRRTC